MKCTPLMMFVSPALEFVLFVCIGLSEAAPRSDVNDVKPFRREPREASETTLDLLNATMPNHLPEERLGIATLLALTPAPTTVSPRAFGGTVQLKTTATQTTTTATTVQQTTRVPTTKPREIVTSTTSKQKNDLVHTTPFTVTTSTKSIPSPFPVVKTTFPTAATVLTDRTTSSRSPKSTAPPLTPTTDNSQDSPCNCTSEGVLDPEDCDRVTGQCSCLSGYTGLQCEDCEEGHFSNGSTGCLPCGCDSFGAVEDRCDSAGICVCKTGVYGPKCDECHPGYFRFSSTGCQPCQCSNHSAYCHPQSGICLNCQGNTKGPGCEECKYNFYRRPDAAPTDACLPCPCSTVTSTGSCHFDSAGRPVCDQCRPEYQGPNCDQCRDGFYNSDSICVPCECHGNANPAADPRLCNPDTGHCLSCANNTAGPRCELCAPGFSGDPLTHGCTPADVKTLPGPEIRTTTTAPPRITRTTSTPDSGRMTSMTNSTGLRTAVTTQALLTSLGSPTDNTTAAVTEVSWTQFNIIVLAVIIVVVVLLMGFVGGVYTYREYQNRKLNAPFWTIELKEDNISFSSYHDSIPNADVSGLLEDEASEAAPNGQLALTTSMNMYKA